MIVVDTNVLVFAASPAADEHVRCRARLESLRAGVEPFFSTWPIFFEFLRVTTHRGLHRRPRTVRDAWAFLAALAESPGFRLLAPGERFAEIAAQTIVELPDLSGSVLHDAHTAILMREHGLRKILTRDTDFHRFPFLDVVDPLREES